jgi:hypothetical protein
MRTKSIFVLLVMSLATSQLFAVDCALTPEHKNCTFRTDTESQKHLSSEYELLKQRYYDMADQFEVYKVQYELLNNKINSCINSGGHLVANKGKVLPGGFGCTYEFSETAIQFQRAIDKCKTNPTSCGIETSNIWINTTSKTSIKSKLQNSSYDINGYFIKYDSDTFDWIYVSKDTKNIAKLEPGSDSEGNVRWTFVHSAKEAGFTSVRLSDDKNKITFGSAKSIDDLSE